MTDTTSTLIRVSAGDPVLASLGNDGGVPVTSEPLRPGTHDLLAAARIVRGNGEWIGGISVDGPFCGGLNYSWDCTDGVAWDGSPLTGAEPTFTTIVGSPSWYTYEPYWLVAIIECSTFGTPPDALRDQARSLLNSGAASQAIEAELAAANMSIRANGGTPTSPDRNPAFQYDATAPVATAQGPVQAMAVLSAQARLQAPGLGRYMIHASPDLVVIWTGAGVVRSEGGVLLSPLDDIVVAGSGYYNQAQQGLPAPTPGAGSTAWISGIVTVYLGDVMDLSPDSAILSAKSNRLRASSARPAAAVWPPCFAPIGVAVDYAIPAPGR